MTERRRTFAPVVMLGLAGGALAAVAASQAWFHATGNAAGLKVSVAVKGSDAAPLGLALALVGLASWGVVLVTRSVVRRLGLILGLVASVGLLAVVLRTAPDAHEIVSRFLQDRGANEVASLNRGGWFWTTGVAALAQALAQIIGLRFMTQWPTMASRYDAPGSQHDALNPDAPVDVETAERAIWSALDEGRDPTEQPPI